RRSGKIDLRDRLRFRVRQHPTLQRGVSRGLPPVADGGPPRPRTARRCRRCRAPSPVALFRREEPTMAKGTLIAAMNIGQAAEDEFQPWYATAHRPDRQRGPALPV